MIDLPPGHPRADNCPECLERHNTTLSVDDIDPDGYRARYRCRACNWSWRTSWGYELDYVEWDLG